MQAHSIPLVNAPSEESENELQVKGTRKQKRLEQPESLLSKLADYGLALFFLLFVVGMVLICFFFGPGAPPSTLKNITLDDLFDPTLKAKTPTVTWLKEGNAYTIFSPTNNIEKHFTVNNDFTILADQSKAIDKDNKQLNFSVGYQFSYDEKYILIPVNVKMRWRHSFYANYLIWDVSTQTFKPLGQLLDTPVIINAQWSTTDHTIAFVMNDDIYLTTAENPEKYIQVTQDGISNIENGVMAWVYEEEVFSDYNAIWWRPAVDGQTRPSQFVFFRFNNTNVPSFSYPIYQDVEYSPYTTIVDLKYPKSGNPNPVVSMVLYDVSSNSTYTLPGLNDEYITDVHWVNSDLLVCRTTNRMQNAEKIFIYELSGRTITLTKSFFTQNVENGWIVPRPYSLVFLSSTQFVYIRNNTDNYHLFLVDTSKQTFINVTFGSWDVTDLVGCNTAEGIVFFMGALPDPTERHLYAIQIDINNNIIGSPYNLTSNNGYYSVQFSDDGTNYIQNYKGPGIPNSKVFQAPTKIPGAPTFVRDLETNKALADKLIEYSIPTKTFIEVEGSNPGIRLNTWYLLPSTLSSSYYYPVLFDIYCGPNSQTVTKQWKLGFDEYVTSSLGIIVASVDCSGTGARGISFMQNVYTRLGSLEAKDIITVAKKLGELNWMDSGRIGIWGWSYGGYMTLRTLIEDGGNVFKSGISVAPVTDWRLYDTFYTERYMQEPEMNVFGYNQSSILIGAQGLGKVPFLLVHGTGDDNVHFQNTVLLNDKLVSLGIQYETMFYANRQHAINSQGSLKHLYRLITNFLIKNLSGLSEVRERPSNN